MCGESLMNGPLHGTMYSRVKWHTCSFLAEKEATSFLLSTALIDNTEGYPAGYHIASGVFPAEDITNTLSKSNASWRISSSIFELSGPPPLKTTTSAAEFMQAVNASKTCDTAI